MARRGTALRTGAEPQWHNQWRRHAVRTLERPRSLADLTAPERASELSSTLAEWIVERRWFRGRGRRVRSARLADVLPVTGRERDLALVLLEVTYGDGDLETYGVPMAMTDASEPQAEIGHEIARLVQDHASAGFLVDAAGDPAFVTWLVRALAGRQRIAGRAGELVGRPTSTCLAIVGPATATPVVEAMQGEQSNTSIRWGDTGILKLYRVIETGENPEIEMGRVLTQRGFRHAPATAGWVEYRGAHGTASVAIMQAFVDNRGDTFDVAQRAVEAYLETVIGLAVKPPSVQASISQILHRSHQPVGDGELPALVGSFIGTAELLGRRTGELHRVLGAPSDDAAFAPERMMPFHQRSLYQSVRGASADALRQLRHRLGSLPGPVRTQAEAVLARSDQIDARLRQLLDSRIGGMLIRAHGDYHAEQVLVTGDNLMITDFEGQPLQPISQRRLKRPALADVAGMIRSLHYAANGALVVRGEPDHSDLSRWADAWYVESAAAFLRGYLAETEGTGLLPADDVTTAILLDVLLLQKATYELRYELGARPDWVAIPLRGLEAILADDPADAG